MAKRRETAQSEVADETIGERGDAPTTSIRVSSEPGRYDFGVVSTATRKSATSAAIPSPR